MVLILVVDVICMAAGGYTAALIARGAEVRHAFYLGILLVLMGAVSMALMSGGEPLWYQLARLLVSLPGVLAGGYVVNLQRGAVKAATSV